MTQKEKVGIGILLGLFTVLALLLFLTIKRPPNSPGSFENNVLIEQRQRNIGQSP